MAKSVFEQLGGFAAVSSLVMDFYDRVLESDLVGDFFDGVDMTKMVDHQTKFVSSILGGPASYTDEQLRKSHMHLKISEEQFDEICKLLDETLEDNDVGQAERDVVRQQFKARRSMIVKS